MDFIKRLPVSNGCSDILAVVDRLIKQAIFIPTPNTLDSAALATLFIFYVFSKHGVPSHVMSDCKSEFILRFSKLLAQTLSMRLHFTSGYHPEANRQSERVNQTLEQYIWMYCNYQQTDWVELLPLAKFTYNNTPSATTGVSPFYANKDYHPRLQVHTLQDLSSKNACFFADKLATVHSELKDVILEAQKCYQVPTNAHRSMPPNYQIGDQVFVLAKFLQTMRPSRKLAKRSLGLFTITGKPSSHFF